MCWAKSARHVFVRDAIVAGIARAEAARRPGVLIFRATSACLWRHAHPSICRIAVAVGHKTIVWQRRVCILWACAAWQVLRYASVTARQTLAVELRGRRINALGARRARQADRVSESSICVRGAGNAVDAVALIPCIAHAGCLRWTRLCRIRIDIRAGDAQFRAHSPYKRIESVFGARKTAGKGAWVLIMVSWRALALIRARF